MKTAPSETTVARRPGPAKTAAAPEEPLVPVPEPDPDPVVPPPVVAPVDTLPFDTFCAVSASWAKPIAKGEYRKTE